MNQALNMLPAVAWPAAAPDSVIMQPTTLCNLDCRYCYLPFRHTEHLMSATVAEAVATTVNRWAADRPGFEVVWHGGEPLAAGHAHLRRLMSPFGDVIHTVQTNATLIDDAWCRFFRAHDMRVGISIDGPESMNADRVSRSGAPAFLRVHQGIDSTQVDQAFGETRVRFQVDCLQIRPLHRTTFTEVTELHDKQATRRTRYDTPQARVRPKATTYRGLSACAAAISGRARNG